MFLGIWNNQDFSVYLETVSKFLTEHSDDGIGQRSSQWFPMFPFSTPWKHLEVEKWCIGNEWVNRYNHASGKKSMKSLYTAFSSSRS